MCSSTLPIANENATVSFLISPVLCRSNESVGSRHYSKTYDYLRNNPHLQRENQFFDRFVLGGCNACYVRIYAIRRAFRAWNAELTVDGK
jgi:hypothetical protein